MQRPWLALAFTFWLGSLAPLLALVLGLATALLALRRLPALALAGTALAAGGGLGLAEARFLAERPAAPEDLTATVRRVERKGDRFYFELSPDAAPAWGIRAQQAHRPPGLAAGARVRVLGTLSPFDPADNPGGFDGEAWAARRHLAWRAHGEVLLLAPAGAPAEGLQAMRDEAWRRLQALERPFGAGVLAGLLLGDRAAMPPDAERAFLESGTAHLLSVSGTHVGGVAALLIFGLGRLGRRLHLVHPELPALLLAVPITVLFVLLAQAPLAAARTGVMVTLYLLGRALGRTPDPLNLLGFAALWALCEAPSTASEPAFQLSFGAVLALLTLTGGATGLRGLVVASFVSFVATAPLQAWHFGTFCPISLPANLLLIPLTSLVLVPLGLVGLVVAPWTTLPLEWAAAGSEFLAAMAEIFSSFMGMWTVGAHGAAWLAAPLIVLIGLRMGRWRAALVPAVAAIGLTFWWAPPSHTVDFVAVGQGDAVVVRSGGQVLLVDTGPPTGTPALLGYLRREGIGRIDRVIISHAHPDHDGGLEALAGELPIGEVWTHGRPLTSRHWRGIRAALGKTPVRAAPLGSHPMGALTVEVLLTDAPADLEENDASVALRVRGAGGSVLLTGDLEAAGEARLVAVLPPATEPTVLKAPHHGSKTSSSEALIDAVRPAAVVFTTGRRNRFGFPHEVVKARYAARNVPTWDTAADGRVRVHLGALAIEGMRRSQVSLENQEVE